MLTFDANLPFVCCRLTPLTSGICGIYGTGANAGPHWDCAGFFFFCLLFFKWSGRVKLWYPAPWVGNTNVCP